MRCLTLLTVLLTLGGCARTGPPYSPKEALRTPGQYGMMTYLHEGKQYVVVQIMGQNHPGSLAALRLP